MGRRARVVVVLEGAAKQTPARSAAGVAQGNEVLLPVRTYEDHTIEPEPEPGSEPVAPPPARPTVVPVVRPWIQRSNVFRRGRDRVRSHIVVEAFCSGLHPLDDVAELGFR